MSLSIVSHAREISGKTPIMQLHCISVKLLSGKKKSPHVLSQSTFDSGYRGIGFIKKQTKKNIKDTTELLHQLRRKGNSANGVELREVRHTQ